MDIAERTISQRCAVLAVDGRVTAVTAPELRTAIRRQVDAGRVELVIDLAGVSFLDSSGLASLISGLKATREAGGWLRLAALRDTVRSIFTLTMLDRVLELHADVEAALAEKGSTSQPR
jgi:anti-sigma B factor antagonist